MELVNGTTGKQIKSEPKLVETQEIKLLMHIYDNGMTQPEIQVPEGMDKFQAHFWISKFRELAGQ